jgi:hypothetical protein
MAGDEWWHDLPVKSEAEMNAEMDAEMDAMYSECVIGCDWPGCPTRGNHALEPGWLITTREQHPRWPHEGGFYCPAHGEFITRWYEEGRYARRSRSRR